MERTCLPYLAIRSGPLKVCYCVKQSAIFKSSTNPRLAYALMGLKSPSAVLSTLSTDIQGYVLLQFLARMLDSGLENRRTRTHTIDSVTGCIGPATYKNSVWAVQVEKTTR